MKQESSTGTKLNTASPEIIHVNNKNIELVEDLFGIYVDPLKQRHRVKRFTWRNHNGIEAQVITYGARITSLKLPNRKGIVEDVVLGFSDLGGYLYYDQLYFGATIGRITGKVKNATCVINERQYWLSANDGLHHSNGGYKGFDKAVWTSSVEGNKVFLSYISRHKDEGYPGDIFVCSSFELTSKNEFIIDMEAKTTRPTILNLSNLLYFNLGSHGSGPDNLFRHIVSINSNCFLPVEENGIPNGEIINVLHSQNDFQVPVLLGPKIENSTDSKSGYDSYLCVNRSVNQELCFVARALHPPSGRILEVYSNQNGVYFSTANHFDYGVPDLLSNYSQKDEIEISDDDLSELLSILHGCVAETLTIDSKTNYSELRSLIRKLMFRCSKHGLQGSFGSSNKSADSKLSELSLNSLQIKYLENIAKAACDKKDQKHYQEVEKIVRNLIESAVNKSSQQVTKKQLVDTQVSENSNENKENKVETWQDRSYSPRHLIKSYNKIPPIYTNDNRVHGKNDAIYKKYGGMCFQTQNYPNSTYYPNFPSCAVRPGETYKHTIVYRFWLQSGDPNMWMKRNCPEAREKTKSAKM